MIKNLSLRKFMLLFIGIFLIIAAVSVFRFCDIGMDPFSGMNLGLSKTLGLEFGIINLLVNFVIFIGMLVFDRSKIGLGTFINIVVVGFASDYFVRFLNFILPQDLTFVPRLLIFLIGFLLLIIGVVLYFDANLGISPYDSVAIIAEKFFYGKLTFRSLRVISDVTCLIAGFLLGSTIGIGTLILALGTGPSVKFMQKKLHGRHKIY